MNLKSFFLDATNIVILSWFCVFLVIGAFVTGYFVGRISNKGFAESVLFIDSSVSYDYVNNVSCKSNSMGLTVNCGDLVYVRELKQDDVLNEGEIYLFRRENSSVVHRLVLCLDVDCNETVFKGDNNEIGELVSRSDIYAKAVRVEYG